MKNEFLALEDIPDIDEGNLRYDMFVKAYNETREHGGINGLTPSATTTVLLLPGVLFAQTEGWSDQDIDALKDCTDQGYEDGQNNPFNHEKFRQCEALSSSLDSSLEGEKSTYYEAFINGCIDAGNARDICEVSTDE